MRSGFRSVMCAVATVAVVAVFSLTIRPAAGQSPTAAQFPAAYRAPRAADGKADLNGIWEALTPANFDIEDHEARPGLHPELLGAYGGEHAGQGIVEGGPLPYRPEMLAKRKANFDNRGVVHITADPGRHDTGDPELKCYRPGVPRANYMPFPFQIIQGPKFIMMAYEYAHTLRTIYMDAPTEAPADTWEGWSNGRWDGDTLVVDSTGFVPYTWFDRVGNFHSDALHVVERYTPVSPYHLMYEATIEDPQVFTRPWKMSFPSTVAWKRMFKSWISSAWSM